MGKWANSFKHTAGAMALTYLAFCTNSSLHQSGAAFLHHFPNDHTKTQSELNG